MYTRVMVAIIIIIIATAAQNKLEDKRLFTREADGGLHN